MLLGLLFALCTTVGANYVIPDPKFEVMRPIGIRVSIPDEEGMMLFAFHGNLNKALKEKSSGQIYGDVLNKTKGRWVYENKKVKVKLGDEMNFWMFVFKNGEGYMSPMKTYKFSVSDLKNNKHFMNKRYRRHTYSEEDMNEFPGYNYYRPHNRHHPHDFFKPKQYFNSYEREGSPHYFGSHHHRYHHKHPFNHHHHPHHNCYGDSEEEEFMTTEEFSDMSTEVFKETTTTQSRTIAPSTKETPIPTSKTIEIPPSTSFPDIDIRFGAE